MTDIVAWRWRFKGHGPNAPWYYTTEVLQPESYKEMQGLVLDPEWQPIETAPKDGTFIDLWVVHPDRSGGGFRETSARWLDGDWRSADGGWIEGFFDPVTNIPAIRISHWMPLPAPPTTGGANG